MEYLVCLARFLEAFRRELPDGLEHPVAPLARADEALVEQRLQGVELGVRDLLRRFERAAAGEGRKAAKEALLFLVEQIVTPLDRCAQRRLPRLCVAPALEQIKAVPEPFEKLRGREKWNSGGSELEGKWQVIEPFAQLVDVLVRFVVRLSRLRARNEE